ncbi:helix-turn-helix domain-containing protein [Mycobacterium sp.]
MSGESASIIAATLGVSRTTVYRVLADLNGGEE